MNDLNHNRTLANLYTEVKYAMSDRRGSRYGRNGETYSTTAWRMAVRRYNKAVRKASKQQLKKFAA